MFQCSCVGSNAFSADIQISSYNGMKIPSQFEINRNIILEGIQETEIPLLIILLLLQQFGEDLKHKIDLMECTSRRAPSAYNSTLLYQYNR
jgi:hypothetical protein